MSDRNQIGRAAAAIAAIGVLLACPWAASRAEVSVDPNATIILGYIIDDPDPVGSELWQAIRNVPPSRVLNADGFLRGDGSPHVTWDPGTDWPLVVWAWNNGTEHDIAFAEWDGQAWTLVEFLTNGVDDESDPRVFVEDDGTVRVVWWNSTTGQVWAVTRAAGSTVWGVAQLVTAGGRRPSIAVHSGGLYAAYERDSAEPGMAQDVVVVRQPVVGGGFVEELVVSTTRTERLDVMIHAQDGKLWLDWKHDSDQFGCAEYDANGGGAWHSMATEPWTDGSWVGVEEMRQNIRGHVLTP